MMKLYPKQVPLNTWGVYIDDKLTWTDTLPTLRKLSRVVLEFSIELDTM